MKISGLQKLTLLDFPEKTACTIFTYGCNFRCPFCHNASLVTGENTFLGEQEVFSFLEKRRGVLEGVCITGGEPLLQQGLEEFIERAKGLGYLIKLDTNGSDPDRLRALYKSLDYVAMDIKNSLGKYNETAGVKVETEKIKESAALLMGGAVDYEFRTTVVKELHDIEDFALIGSWLKRARRYFLQGFEDSGDLICEGLHPWEKSEMEKAARVLKRYIPETQIRG